jgi:competence ComEA-like helix-hairpin-helix protein
MLKKSQFFYFFVSFAITSVAGLFIWTFFVLYPENISKQELTASVLQFKEESENSEEQSLTEKIIEFGIDEFGADIESTEDQLDEIQEKLDIIKQQVQELINQQNFQTENKVKEKSAEKTDEVEQEEKIEQVKQGSSEDFLNAQDNSCVGQININTSSAEDLDKITQVGPAISQKIIEARPFCSINDLTRVSGIGEATLQKIITQGCAFTNITCGSSGGGGVTTEVEKAVYPKIIISEMQISPIEQRFIELYNPNNTDVNLTNWYLQRKTATSDTWSSLVTSTDFSGKTILANSYLLISRSDILADIFVENLTLTSGNSLVLKNPDREISDEISWSEISENLSWCYDFSLCSPTPRAQNVKYVEPPPPPPPTDTDAPEISFDLAPIQTSLEFPINFTITDISTTTTPSNLANFDFRWSDNSGVSWYEKGIQSISGLSVDLIEIVSGSNGQVFLFQAKATDVAGNTSDWLPIVPVQTTISIPVIFKNILINEIQISGVTASDEFIELYNPNDSVIDLTGFALKKKTSSGNESNLVSSGSFTGTIPALGYFLITPQSNDDGTEKYMGLAVSDLRYSGKSYSVASNNTVLLYASNGDLQDKVGFGSAQDFEVAPVPNPDNNKSISRTGGVDTDNNSIDFVILDTPTPKE